MKILLIGANGFLGIKILKYSKEICPNDEIIASDLDISLIPQVFNPVKIDLTVEASIKQVILESKPDLIILTAAMTNVDLCEDKSDLARKINTIGPKIVANIAKEVNSRLIFISTDFVFDGQKGNYKEDDEPNPISKYGQSKLDAELAIKESGVNYLICRTSVLFGWPIKGQRDNFFTWAYKKLKNNEKLSILTTQINNPTLCDDLACNLLKLRNFKQSDVLHTCGSERISRFDFVKKLALEFNFDEKLVSPIKHFPQKAARPPDGSMINRKIKEKFGLEFRDITNAFKFLKQELDNNQVDFL